MAGRVILEMGNLTGVDQTEICEQCDIRAVSGYCLECTMYMCQSCFDRHRRSLNNRSHVLQDVKEQTAGFTTICFENCAKHVQHEVKFYCTHHNLTGCAECMLFAHKTCKYEYITEAAKRFEESGELACVRESIIMLENTHDEYTKAMVCETVATEMMTKAATEDIETFTDSIITCANEAKQRVLEEVKVIAIANKLLIVKLEDEIHTIGSQLEALSSAFRDEEQVHKLFLLAIDTKPKLSSIRDAFSNIDCTSIITDYTFETSRFFNDMVSNSRPFSRFKVNSPNQIDKDDNLDFMLEQKRKKSQQTQQQVSQQENELHRLTSNMRKLEDKHATLKQLNAKTVHERQHLEDEIKKMKLEFGKMEKEIQRMRDEVTLSCGHTSSIGKMEKNRTIRCTVCDIIFGDQPAGTMDYTAKTYDFGAQYYELQFQFPQGKQSKLNCNPGNSYTETSMKGYLCNANEGIAVMKMLKKAFDRKLLFTIDSSGKITLGGIELFKQIPYVWDDVVEVQPKYPGYVARVKKQLAAVGIMN